MIPAADQAIRRNVATRRAARQQPGQDPRATSRPARRRPAPGPPMDRHRCRHPHTHLPATPGALGLSDTEGSRRAIGPGSWS